MLTVLQGYRDVYLFVLLDILTIDTDFKNDNAVEKMLFECYLLDVLWCMSVYQHSSADSCYHNSHRHLKNNVLITGQWLPER